MVTICHRRRSELEIVIFKTQTDQTKITAISQNEPPNDKQQRVIDLLLTAKTVTEAAKLTGIGRSTIQCWKREDAECIAGLNSERIERRRHLVHELKALDSKAIVNVRQAIEEGDLKTSLVLLTKIGVMEPQPIGTTDPENITSDRERTAVDLAGKRNQHQADEPAQLSRAVRGKACFSLLS